MKAEDTKERKREEKKRKGKDLIWLIFFFLGEHFSSTLLKSTHWLSTRIRIGGYL